MPLQSYLREQYDAEIVEAAAQRQAAAPAQSGNIFDRLTDTSSYSGTHKHRFDADGQGRGLAGRDAVSKGGGIATVGTRSNYTGGTNGPKTDTNYHDSSQFLTRGR